MELNNNGSYTVFFCWKQALWEIDSFRAQVTKFAGGSKISI